MFDYSDNIHFVGYQLDHYYGTNNWPWRMCAEVTGVSISTVRKYYNQQWEVEQEKFDLINQALNKLDFSNREIKLLTTQKEQYFAVDGHYEIKVVPFPKETPIEEKRIFIAATGAGISLIVIGLSSYMIVKSTNEIKRLENGKYD